MLLETSADSGRSDQCSGVNFDYQKTSLYYYRARYYDALSGRFLSEDTITFRGGTNFYRYGKDNPGNLADPFGFSPGAPAIPFPIPWVPPFPIVSPIVRGIGGLIGLILGEVAFPDATGMDDASAIPKPTPTDCDKRRKDCDIQHENDNWLCSKLPTPAQRARCWQSANQRYGDCIAGRPPRPLVDW